MRGERLAAEQRRKAQVKRRFKQRKEYAHLVDNPKFVGRMAQVRGVCSCSMCCNPRRHGSVTKQEEMQNEKDRKLDS